MRRTVQNEDDQTQSLEACRDALDVVSDFWGRPAYEGFHRRLLRFPRYFIAELGAYACRNRIIRYFCALGLTFTLKSLPEPTHPTYVAMFAPTQTNRRAISRVLRACGMDHTPIDTLTQPARIGLRWRAAQNLWRLNALITRTHSPFVMMQNVITVVAFAHFQAGVGNSRLRTVIVGNDHSPLSVGLARAAQHCGLTVIYIQHAPVNDGYPALSADVAILFDRASLDRYTHHRPPAGEVCILSPFEAPAIPLTVPQNFKTVGILLSRVPDLSALADLIRDLQDIAHVDWISLRPHPENKSDLEQFASIESVDIQSGDLTAFAASVDIIIVPGSGATVELLHRGVPVVYLPKLDHLGFDPHGFVQDGIVLDASKIAVGTWGDALTQFYDAEWRTRFSRYTVMTASELAQQKQAVRLTLTPLLAPHT